jgi:hypothetical protein
VRRVRALPTTNRSSAAVCRERNEETYLVVCLDGAKLRLDALVSFLFLEEPQAGLVFHTGELGVFLLGLQLFLQRGVSG